MLTRTLALAHPIIPFVTEEIYSFVPGASGLLAAGVASEDGAIDEPAEETARARDRGGPGACVGGAITPA